MTSTLTRSGTTGHVRTLPMLPPGWAAAARGRIDEWLDAGMPDAGLSHLDRADRMHHYTYVSYGDDELRGSPLLHRCISHHVRQVREIVGADTMLGDEMQIALRFPGQAGGPHLDGMGDDARLDDPAVPTAVLAVYLSDVGPDSGALGTWPQLLPGVREYGRRAAAEPGHDPDQSAYRDLMAQARALPATALTGPAGSAFLLPGGLPHCNLPHSGPDVRYAVFMRFYRRRHCPLGPKAPTGRRALAVLADPGAAWV